jgi:hypothetical protein
VRIATISSNLKRVVTLHLLLPSHSLPNLRSLHSYEWFTLSLWLHCLESVETYKYKCTTQFFYKSFVSPAWDMIGYKKNIHLETIKSWLNRLFPPVTETV